MNNSLNAELERVKTTEELYADLDALRLRIAFQREIDDDIAKYETKAKDSMPEHESVLSQLDSKIMGLIDRSYRKALMKRLCVVYLPRIGKIAAALLLVFYLGLTTAIAAIPSVRVAILEMFADFEDEYVSIELRESGAHMEVPAAWEGIHYLSYIPDGYDLHRVESNFVSYRNNENQLLRFCEYDTAHHSNVDISEEFADYTVVNGSLALVSEEEPWISVVWVSDNSLFVIDCNLPKEEAFEIANGVTLIK